MIDRLVFKSNRKNISLDNRIHRDITGVVWGGVGWKNYSIGKYSSLISGTFSSY